MEKTLVAKHQSKQRTQHGSSKGKSLLQAPSKETVAPSVTSPESQLTGLLQQKKYRQALEELKKIRRSQPEFEFTPTEAEIWLLRGRQEFEQEDFKTAESSFRQALKLGLTREVHYWLARCLVSLNRLDAALDLIRPEFESGSLPKEFAVCYLKLLLLKGDTNTVEQLISQQSKRFSAAQLHWVRGVLSLKQGNPSAALTSFQKIKRPLTPGDVPDAWVVYSQQAIEQWDAAATKLGLMGLQRGMIFGKPKFLEHPVLTRLATFQQAKTGEAKNILLKQTDQTAQEVMNALVMVQLLDDGNYHDAGHALLRIGRSNRFPELANLKAPLLTLAGQQAFSQGETECAEQLWQPLLNESSFNPQLAVNYLEVLELNDAGQARQRLLTRLIKWIEQDAKQHPEHWTDDRRKLTLAQAHCRLADAWMSLGRHRAAVGEVQQAERICPTSPEVLGRKGLLAANEEQTETAIDLLTRAIEGGCRYSEVYDALLECWRALGNTDAVNAARRQYGKFFGDLNAETDIEMAPWMDALSTRDYAFYRRLVQEASAKDPAVRACQIFVESVQGNPTSSGKVAIDQTKATQHWDKLLQTLSPQEQISVLEAIALSILLFAKREKGIAALITQYLVRIFNLTGEYSEAKAAHLVVLTVKESGNPQKLELPLQAYLSSMPQPGNALAALQLQVRRFAQTIVLRSFIDQALAQEPQNPLLLLAKATTFPPTTQQYEDFKQQGFELARRLQDAKALQAFRTEQAFLAAQQVQQVLPSPDRFAPGDPAQMEDMIEALIRNVVGKQIPKAELDRMLPELKQRMLEDMPDFGADEFDSLDDEDDFDLDAIFGGKPKKRKRSFRDL
jgi:tetratricopeptide (TPR) repeat protein